MEMCVVWTSNGNSKWSRWSWEFPSNPPILLSFCNHSQFPNCHCCALFQVFPGDRHPPPPPPLPLPFSRCQGLPCCGTTQASCSLLPDRAAAAGERSCEFFSRQWLFTLEVPLVRWELDTRRDTTIQRKDVLVRLLYDGLQQQLCASAGYRTCAQTNSLTRTSGANNLCSLSSLLLNW